MWAVPMAKLTSRSKLTVFVMALVALVLGVYLKRSIAQVPVRPQASANMTSIDLGALAHGRVLTNQAITITNHGAVPLVLGDPQVSCGCLQVDVGQSTLKPGESTFVSLTLEPALKDAGNKLQAVVIPTNDPGTTEFRLMVSYSVISDVNTLTSQYEIRHELPSSADRDLRRFQVLVLDRSEEQDIDVRLVSHSDRLQDVAVKKIAYGCDKQNNPKYAFRVECFFDAGAPPGEYHESIELVTTDPQRPAIRPTFLVQVLPKVRVLPRLHTCAFGQAQRRVVTIIASDVIGQLPDPIVSWEAFPGIQGRVERIDPKQIRLHLTIGRDDLNRGDRIRLPLYQDDSGLGSIGVELMCL